jgi:hypothetical protein
MPNTQLTDKEYLYSLNFVDFNYLQNLCLSLWGFVKNSPILLVIDICNSNKGETIIKVYSGENKHTYKVDITISVADFIYQIKKDLYPLFPKFDIEEEIEVELDPEEILRITSVTDTPLTDVIFMTKKKKVHQTGVILKVFLKADEFLFEYNGKKSIRTTCKAFNINDILPIKMFMQSVRTLCSNKVSGERIREYIFIHSKEIKKLPEKEREVLIDYPAFQLYNFFKIHYQDLWGEPLQKIDSLIYLWGKFKIIFPDKIIEKDCLDFYNSVR